MASKARSVPRTTTLSATKTDSRRTYSKLSPTRSPTCSPAPPRLFLLLLRRTMLTLHANAGVRTCIRFCKAYQTAVRPLQAVRRARRNRRQLRSGRRRKCGMAVPQARSKTRCSICDSWYSSLLPLSCGLLRLFFISLFLRLLKHRRFSFLLVASCRSPPFLSGIPT